MRRTLLYMAAVLLTSSSSLLTACYEDKGNYTYNEDVSDITVKLKDLYGLRKGDGKMTYTITPEITTDDGDKSYLDYVWILDNELTGTEDTVSTTENAMLQFDPDADDFSYNYNIRLYVTDTRTGGVTLVPSSLEIAKPYEYSWIVLHEESGHAQIGAVEYVGSDAVVSPDAYTAETGKTLTGKPVGMEVVKNSVGDGWDYSSLSQVFVATTNTAESGLLNQIDHFKLMAAWDDLVYTDQRDDIDFSDVQFSSGDSELLLASKGKVFRNNYQSPCLFRLDPDASLTGDYYIDRCAAGPYNIGIAFDRVGRRFLSMDISSSRWRGYEQNAVVQAGSFKEIANTEGLGNAANPSLIPANEEIIGFIPGYRYGTSNPAPQLKFSVYAYGLAPNNVSNVYVFRYQPLMNTYYGAPMPYKYTFTTPNGITADTPMTSSYCYNNLIFYAVDNKIYKLDFTTGTSVLIYSHSDPAAKITSLKMAVEGFVDWTNRDVNKLLSLGEDTYGHPYCRCLGAGVDTSDGKGELVVLQLNSQGKVDSDHKYPSTQVHKGFGRIKSIGFM